MKAKIFKYRKNYQYQEKRRARYLFLGKFEDWGEIL